GGFEEHIGSGIVLTGGTARLEGIVPLAEQVFQAPVRVGFPLALESNDTGSADVARCPAFAAAVGLVQYGARPRDHIPTPAADSRRTGRMWDWFKSKVAMMF